MKAHVQDLSVIYVSMFEHIIIGIQHHGVYINNKNASVLPNHYNFFMIIDTISTVRKPPLTYI
jgi:hypothetical protein